MSAALQQIQEAEEKAKTIVSAAEMNAHELLKQAEEKARHHLEQARMDGIEKQKNELAAHKEECKKHLEKAEKEAATKLAHDRAKWEKKIPTATDTLFKAFQEYFPS